MARREPHRSPFRPEPVERPVGLGEEAAVTAAARDDDAHPRIGHDRAIPKLFCRNERIVVGADDERRHGDALDHPQTAGAVVVVAGIVEAMMGRRERFVERAHGADAAQRAQIEAARRQLRLAAHAPLEVADEIPFVQHVAAPLQRLHAAREVHRRRNGADGPQDGGRLGAVVARQLQRNVAAQRVADDGNRGEAVERHQLLNDRLRVGGQSGVVEAGGQVFRPAAVALVEQHHVEAARERLVRQPAHVVRLARPFEAVEGEQRRPGRRVRLPVAVRQHPRVGRDVEVARPGRRKRGKRALAGPREERHPVAAGGAPCRHEIVHHGILAAASAGRRRAAARYH